MVHVRYSTRYNKINFANFLILLTESKAKPIKQLSTDFQLKRNFLFQETETSETGSSDQQKLICTFH